MDNSSTRESHLHEKIQQLNAELTHTKVQSETMPVN
jgi:hypothetical protein